MVMIFSNSKNEPFCTIELDKLVYSRKYQTGIQLVFCDKASSFLKVDGDGAIDSVYQALINKLTGTQARQGETK